MRNLILIVICFIIKMNATFAEDMSCPVRFTINIQGSTVYFTNTSLVANSGFYINFDDGTPNTPFPLGSTISHTFNHRRHYQVVVSGNTICSTTQDVWIEHGILDIDCNATFTLSMQGNAAYITNIPYSGYLSFGTGYSAYVNNDATANYNYSVAGNYDICFKDSLQLCPAQCQIVHIIDSIPPCNLSFTQTTQGNTATFTNTSTNAHNAILNFGDGTIAPFHNGTTISHLYQNASNYTVCISDSANICPMYCHDVAVNTDTINCNLHFDYTVQNNTVFFTNTVTNNNYGILYFGDGSSTAIYPNQTIAHTYTGIGLYTSCISDSMGLCPAYCTSIYIQNQDTCNINFTYTVQGNQVIFTNTSTHSAGGILGVNGINTYLAAGQSITHIFGAGLYQACLWDTISRCAEYCDTFRIAPVANPCNLQAHLNITTQGLTVTANASVTGLANGTQIAIRIVSNNGNVLNTTTNVSSGLQIGYTNTFANAGTYRICVYVYAPDSGCRDSICENVTISTQQCTADFSYLKNGNIVQFQTANATPWITNAQWSFGDGTYSNDLEPTHTFLDTGYFRICLNASNTSPCPSTQQGCFDSICKYIHICTNMTATESQAELASQVTIFPNPSSNTAVSIRLDNLKAQQVIVYNALGQVLIQKTSISDSTILLDTASFVAGLYTVEIQTDKGKVVKKMVLQ